MLQLHQFSTVPRCSVMTVWSHRISTFDFILSLLNITTIYWILRCMVFILPYLTMLTKVTIPSSDSDPSPLAHRSAKGL